MSFKLPKPRLNKSGNFRGMTPRKPTTIETREKISLARKEYYLQNPDAQKRVSDQLRSMRRTGQHNSERHNQAVRIGILRHLDTITDCNCFAHNPYRHKGGISPLQWKMTNFLADRFDIVIPEVRFGRFSVDVLLAEEWVAFEADGAGWHKDKEKDTKRDAWLLENFDLPVVRLS